MLRDCLKLRTKNAPDVWSTFNTRAQLGASLLGQKKFEEAEPLLKAGYDGMKAREKTIPPQGRVRLTEAAERLVQLYEATERKDEAKKWTAIVVTLEGKLDATIHDAAKQVTIKDELSAAATVMIFQLAEDDDSGGNLNSRITFRAPADGIYRFRATSFNGGRGPFTLTIRSKE